MLLKSNVIVRGARPSKGDYNGRPYDNTKVYIETEINSAHFATEQGKKLVQMLPRRRLGKPEDLDGLLLLLAADESNFINGAIMTADDGMSAS